MKSKYPLEKIRRTIVSCCAIVALLVIELQALAHGINGTLRLLIVGCIAGIAGFRIARIKK